MSKTLNAITVAALTTVQAKIINQARASSGTAKKGPGAEERKQIKREVYSIVRAKFGLPDGISLSANTTDPDSPHYLVLHVGKGSRARKAPQANAGKAFVLGADGKWDGTYATKDQLVPPPAPPAPAPAPISGSVFAGSPLGKWFRLDPTSVAAALTASDEDEDTGSGVVDMSTEGGDLPTPHLMLNGRTDLAITADGSIYRKV